MNVNRRSWHARVYLWWHAHKYHSCPYCSSILDTRSEHDEHWTLERTIEESTKL